MASPQRLLPLLVSLLAHRAVCDAAAGAGATPSAAAAPPAAVAGVSATTYELVGHGYCEDAKGQRYEQWYLPGYKASRLTYEADVKDCSCPECEEACDLFLVCLGFEYYCCQSGNRCIAGGAVVFGKGLRPGRRPPGNFSVAGPYDSDTSGPDFNGTGPIAGVRERGPDGFCYRKTGPTAAPPPSGETFVGQMYEPHTMEGTTRTVMPNWEACQLHCQSHPGCKTWGFWPDGGCHLQGSNTTLVEAECPEGEKACVGLGVISGPRDFSAPLAAAGSAAAGAAAAGGAAGAAARVQRNSSGTLMDDASAAVAAEEPGEGGLRGALVLVLLLVVAGLALYMNAQADWSKRRKKKRRIKETLRRKELEASFSANSMSGGSDGDASETETESDEEVHPLSRKRAPKV